VKSGGSGRVEAFRSTGNEQLKSTASIGSNLPALPAYVEFGATNLVPLNATIDNVRIDSAKIPDP
jgi:hypothetical protein